MRTPRPCPPCSWQRPWHTVLRPTLLALLTLSLMALSSGAFALTFSTIDVPGATSTEALGINAAGQIVGYYCDSSFMGHGFVAR